MDEKITEASVRLMENALADMMSVNNYPVIVISINNKGGLFLSSTINDDTDIIALLDSTIKGIKPTN